MSQHLSLTKKLKLLEEAILNPFYFLSVVLLTKLQTYYGEYMSFLFQRIVRRVKSLWLKFVENENALDFLKKVLLTWAKKKLLTLHWGSQPTGMHKSFQNDLKPVKTIEGFVRKGFQHKKSTPNQIYEASVLILSWLHLFFQQADNLLAGQNETGSIPKAKIKT